MDDRDALWRAFEHERGLPLWTVSTYSPDPRLVVLDPHLALGATPLARAVPTSTWQVATLLRNGRPIAVRLERSIHAAWAAPGAIETGGDRAWRFSKRRRGGTAIWTIRCEGVTVRETTEGSDAKETRHATSAAAHAAMRRRIQQKARSGYEAASSGPPARWERATFADGAVDFPVDYATLAVTDDLGLEHLRASAALRTQVARAVAGPPGWRVFEHGAAFCHLAWLSAPGDGRYACHWGLSEAGDPTSLLVGLGP